MDNINKLPITNKHIWRDISSSSGFNYHFTNDDESLYIRKHYSMHDKTIKNQIECVDIQMEGIQIRWNFRINLD